LDQDPLARRRGRDVPWPGPRPARPGARRGGPRPRADATVLGSRVATGAAIPCPSARCC